MKKKMLSMFIVGTLMLTSVVPVYAAPNEEVIQNQQKYEELNKKISDIQGEVYKLNNEIDPLVDKIKTNKKLIEDIKSEIDNTKKEIETSKVEISEKEDVLGKRLREVYKSGGQSSYLGVLFSADSFSDFISKLDATDRLVKIDKKIITDLVDKKESLDNKVSSLEDKGNEITKVNEETDKALKEAESKKSEQEKVINNLKAEQDKFDKEFLAVSEKKLVEHQFSIIDSSNSIQELKDAVNQLTSIKNNQLKSPTVIEEVSSKIEAANSKIESLQAQQDQQNATNNVPNRGDAISTPGNNGSGTTSGNPGNPGNPGSVSGNAIVSYAYKFLGTPYEWGATGPNTFDCSGFTSYVYRHAAGIEISRTTYSQINQGRAVSYSELQPGDLVFTYNNEHVGIYVGGGSYIHAPQTGDVVKVSPITSFYAARRIL